jgi:hypothetical protein
MPTAEMVATFANGRAKHAIDGEFRYDRSDNRTVCGRTGLMGVEHWQSGRPIEITCPRCVKLLRFTVRVEDRGNGLVCIAVTGPSDGKSVRSARGMAASRAQRLARERGGTATYVNGGWTVGEDTTETRRIYRIR